MTINLDTDQSVQKARVFFFVVIMLLCGLAYENSREADLLVTVEATTSTASSRAPDRGPASLETARSSAGESASGSAL